MDLQYSSEKPVTTARRKQEAHGSSLATTLTPGSMKDACQKNKVERRRAGPPVLWPLACRSLTRKYIYTPHTLTSVNLGSPEKDFRLSHCCYEAGLWAHLWGIFLIGYRCRRGRPTVGGAILWAGASRFYKGASGAEPVGEPDNSVLRGLGFRSLLEFLL